MRLPAEGFTIVDISTSEYNHNYGYIHNCDYVHNCDYIHNIYDAYRRRLLLHHYDAQHLDILSAQDFQFAFYLIIKSLFRLLLQKCNFLPITTVP